METISLNNKYSWEYFWETVGCTGMGVLYQQQQQQKVVALNRWYDWNRIIDTKMHVLFLDYKSILKNSPSWLKSIILNRTLLFRILFRFIFKGNVRKGYLSYFKFKGVHDYY